MQNGYKKIYSVVLWLIICPTTSFAWYGDWDWHGSGRDHPYSAYIDRSNYIGPADYAPIEPDYVDDPIYVNNVTAPVITPLPVLSPSTPPDEFIVNVPNNHGGYTAVVIKRSGSGFIGPQGEFYPEFPKVSLLKVMYGN